MDDKTVIIINGDECINYEALIDHFVNRELYTGYDISEYLPTLKKIERRKDYTMDFIRDLKAVFDKYYNITMKYLTEKYEEFKTSNYHILFVYMDNFDDIDKFRDYILSKGGKIATLYLSKDGNTDEYHYDYILVVDQENDTVAKYDFSIMIKNMVDEIMYNTYFRR